jgi:hypothetical protein
MTDARKAERRTAHQALRGPRYAGLRAGWQKASKPAADDADFVALSDAHESSHGNTPDGLSPGQQHGDDKTSLAWDSSMPPHSSEHSLGNPGTVPASKARSNTAAAKRNVIAVFFLILWVSPNRRRRAQGAR